MKTEKIKLNKPKKIRSVWGRKPYQKVKGNGRRYNRKGIKKDGEFGSWATYQKDEEEV